jgi:sulfur carrier protein
LNLIRVMPAEGSQARRILRSSSRTKAASSVLAGAAFLMIDHFDQHFLIELNGEPHSIDGDARLLALIEKLKLGRGRIAIELNQAVIPKAEWVSISLKQGDKVEIVNFVGGG